MDLKRKRISRIVSVMILFIVTFTVCAAPAYATTSYVTVKTPRGWSKTVTLKTDKKYIGGKSLTLTYIPGKAVQCDLNRKPMGKIKTRYMGYTIQIIDMKNKKKVWYKPYIRGDSKHTSDKIKLKRNNTYKVKLYAVGGWNSSLPEKWTIIPKLKFTFQNCHLE